MLNLAAFFTSISKSCVRWQRHVQTSMPYNTFPWTVSWNLKIYALSAGHASGFSCYSWKFHHCSNSHAQGWCISQVLQNAKASGAWKYQIEIIAFLLLRNACIKRNCKSSVSKQYAIAHQQLKQEFYIHLCDFCRSHPFDMNWQGRNGSIDGPCRFASSSWPRFGKKQKQKLQSHALLPSA